MSDKNLEATFGEIDLSENFLVYMSSLCMSEVLSDVTFVVENEKLPAHKAILAGQSEYFRALFSGGLAESHQEKIQLKVPLAAFKILLRYLYSGCMSLRKVDEEIVVDILGLADLYGFINLQLVIAKYLAQVISVKNVRVLYEASRLNTSLTHLKESCLRFMDSNASNVLKHKSFIQFSKDCLKEILCRDSFCVPEFEIFIAVTTWCKQHPKVDSNAIISNVRLPLIDFDKHLKAVRTCGILSQEKLLDAIEERNSSKKLPYRILPEQNMAAISWGSKIIKGSFKDQGGELNDSTSKSILSYDLGGSSNRRPVYGVDGTIVVELGIASFINHIKILLHPENYSFSYFVEVSENQSQWNLVADFNNYECQNWQSLYFSSTFAKYIKIATNGQNPITVTSLRALHTQSIPKLVNGLIAASVLIWSPKKSGEITLAGPIFAQIAHLFEYIDRRDIIEQLDQAYFVGSLRIFFWNQPNNSYSCQIEVSTNKQDWKTVANKSNERACSWQTISFTPLPVVYIKINCSGHNCHFMIIRDIKMQIVEQQT